MHNAQNVIHQDVIPAVNEAYLYDGSFDGMLCCVFESFESRQTPLEIRRDEATLLPLHLIATDASKAWRVRKGIIQKISSDALQYVKYGYLTNYHDKELAVIRFLRAGFKHGAKIISMLTDDNVMPLAKAVRLLNREAAKFRQFIRFSDMDGALVAVIEPENNVLPLIAGHFRDRYPNEQFMIYDRTHGAALIYSAGELMIMPAEDLEIPAASEEELRYRRLWRMFYNTIAIKERQNERCRMNFMPKKYWKNMTEFMDDEMR